MTKQSSDYGDFTSVMKPNGRSSTLRGGISSLQSSHFKRDPNMPRKKHYLCLSIGDNITFAPATLMKVEADYMSTVQEQQMIVQDQVQTSIMRNGDLLLDWITMIHLPQTETLHKVKASNLRHINYLMELISYSLRSIGVIMLQGK